MQHVRKLRVYLGEREGARTRVSGKGAHVGGRARARARFGAGTRMGNGE